MANADGQQIPIVEDDQGEGFVNPLTYLEVKELRLEESRRAYQAKLAQRFRSTLQTGPIQRNRMGRF